MIESELPHEYLIDSIFTHKESEHGESLATRNNDASGEGVRSPRRGLSMGVWLADRRLRTASRTRCSGRDRTAGRPDPGRSARDRLPGGRRGVGEQLVLHRHADLAEL